MPRYAIVVTAALLIGLVLFAVYYPYTFFRHTVAFAFTKPELWQSQPYVDPFVIVPAGQRAIYFMVWMVPMLATQAMLLAAIWFCVMLLRGVYFALPTIRALQWVGVFGTLAGVTALGALALNPWMLTMTNAQNHHGPRLVYQSGEIGVLLVGLGVFLVAWVMRLAMKLQSENKEFI